MSYKDELKRKLEAAKVDEEKKRVTLYLAPPLYERLKAFCEGEKVSMNAFVSIAVETALDHTEK